MTLFDTDLAYDDVLSFGGLGTLSLAWLELGSIVFTGAPDDFGVEWFVEDVKGWDSPAVRSSSTPRPEADGLFLPAFRHGGRELDVVGRAFAPSIEEAYAAKQRLFAEVNLRRDVELVVHEDRARRVVVTRNDRLQLAQRSRLLTFSIPLLAADPRKYAFEETTVDVDVDEDVTVTNEGDVGTYPTATIRGPLVNPTLVNVTTGEELSFDVTLYDGSRLDLDLDMRTARAATTSFRATLLPGYSWFDLDPGDTVLRLEGDSPGAGAGLELAFRSAWI